MWKSMIPYILKEYGIKKMLGGWIIAIDRIFTAVMQLGPRFLFYFWELVGKKRLN